jgi:hypothetical protein
VSESVREQVMSAPVDRFGLRFAAAALPPGHMPSTIRAERDSAELEDRPQPMPRSFPHPRDPRN